MYRYEFEDLFADDSSDNTFMESCSIDIDSWISTSNDIPLTEAVFSRGKETVKPIEDKIREIKDLLVEEVNLQNKSINDVKEARELRNHGEHIPAAKIKKFDPVSFWRNNLFKELEDLISKIFGFRNVEIHPSIERYRSIDKMFESRIMNCCIYCVNRFPIEGLVSDSGFYDKSKSINAEIRITLGLIYELEPDEILAVLLHEFGHSIDPALVDIHYTEVNILSKYLTDRKNAINKNEKKLFTNHRFLPMVIVLTVLMSLYMLINSGISWMMNMIIKKYPGANKRFIEKKLQTVRNMVENDKTVFNRQSYTEAYADNFARMYGYGPSLMKGLKKMERDSEKKIRSRVKRELNRQEYILSLTTQALNDSHKTDIHRIRSLIREYKNDIDDPNTPDVVKKQLKEDLNELEKILDEYLYHFSRFQNRINQVINEELEKIENKDEYESNKNKTIKEGFDLFDESRKAYEELKKRKDTITSKEREEIRERFGQSKACSFAKDKDGYYCYTHRCRSKSYKSIDDIPQEDVDFVRSTS